MHRNQLIKRLAKHTGVKINEIEFLIQEGVIRESHVMSYVISKEVRQRYLIIDKVGKDPSGCHTIEDVFHDVSMKYNKGYSTVKRYYYSQFKNRR
jgi:hypothetical protein